MTRAEKNRRVPEHCDPAAVGYSRSKRKASCTRRDASLHERPFALLQLDEHACAFVHAEESTRLVIVDAMRSDDLARRLHRVLEGGAEFLRPGLRPLQGAFGGIEEHEPCVERVGGESIARRGVIDLLINLTKRHR